MRLSLLCALLLVTTPVWARPDLAPRLDPRSPTFWKARPSSRPLIIGSAALDTVHLADGTKLDRVLGGSAVYAAVAAAKGTSPVLVAPIGKDFPKRYVNLLERKGVDTSGLERSSGLSFAWTGRYLNSKDRVTVDTQLGVLADFQPKLPSGARPKYVFLANMSPEQQLHALEQLGRGRGRPRVVLDTMNLWIEKHRPALLRAIKRADLLLLNDEEAPMLAGKKDLAAAARAVLAMGPRMVIVKQGKHGATLYYRGEGASVRSFSVPVYPVQVKDTTGAGDSFGGAILSCLARVDRFDAKSVGTAMVYGAAVASATVESFSLTRLARITPAQIAQRFDHLSRQVNLSTLP